MNFAAALAEASLIISVENRKRIRLVIMELFIFLRDIP